MKRGHKRIPDRSYSNVVRFIKQAVATFDKLVQYPAVESKLLVVDGGQDATIATNCQDDSLFAPALKIIRNSISTGIYESF
jgi:hypothetical protein